MLFFFFLFFFFYLLPLSFSSHSLRCIRSLFHFYSVKGKKKKRKKRKKNKVDKGCPPSSQQREEGGVQIALQKTGLRAEISHNAADKKVGHITFGGHVTGIQTADGVVRRKGIGGGLLLVLQRLPHLKDEVKVGEGGRMKKKGGDKQKKMLGARERGREDEREIKRGIEETERCRKVVCVSVSLKKSKVTVGLALI